MIQLWEGDCLQELPELGDESVKLVVTSPPYNLGKEYERRKSLADYVGWASAVAAECARVLALGGSLCWQVGNFVDKKKSRGSAVGRRDVARFPWARVEVS